MKNYLVFLLVLFPILGYGQNFISGNVTDQQGKPVPNASVFLSNTSLGTKADGNGYFQLNIPSGKYDLVVSCVGFQTHTQTIQSGLITETLTIRLQLKTSQLENLTIEPFEKNGWDKWGVFFTENFIGTSSNALDCRILNKEAIKFRHSKKYNQLVAIATEPLIIENKALGYT
ncbi:MAG TPA: carboxypeptidase-like regulatory domain-containing protein, partial [Flavisolibacter sp.]